MGMDLNIFAARNHEVFKHEGWWDSEHVEQKYYSRKYWDLVQNLSFIPKNYESGEFIEINRDNLEEMIQVACKYCNYWGKYDDVPVLCELRDEYDKLIEDGKHLYLEYDW